MSRLLLNCDIGESFGNWTMGLDAEVMPFIDCANIACGFHAGDPSIMRKTVGLALSNGVQIGALDGICRAQGGRVSYVKPHGAMYNDMMANPAQLRAVLQAVAAYDRTLPLMLMATRDNSAAQQLGDEYGVTLWFEAFADRAYDSAGMLVSRQLPGAVHHDPETIIEQALTIARGDNLTASDGSALHLRANTLCVHGDNASSVAAVRRIREALDQQSAP